MTSLSKNYTNLDLIFRLNEIFKQLLLSIQDQDGCLLILDFNFMASICKFVGNPLN